MHDNLPPLPKEEKPVWERSFLAHVLHGKSFVEQGRAVQRPGLQDHMLKMEIGAPEGAVIELRATDMEFMSERSFSAVIKRDGKQLPAGKALPHEDGKGYQLKLTQTITDGELISLRSDGALQAAGGRAPRRKHALRTRYTPGSR
ncbi:hypothetical protein CBA19CS22_39610 [Caballeronia novacaledonica]|uniref:Uncharacterized protein n=1 Tax=Caballeronia novacaledonica TaxID=1544861 RepID=A0ACB5R6F3_9BURK|nr:hypothetical protein CBA19CS22_39610 [Caballeronia novacaledonica]